MIVLRKFESKDLVNMPKGFWCLLKFVAKDVIIVSCPTCGGQAQIDHEVASDGTVSPSLECPYTGCGFHDNGRLEGWV